LGDDRGGHVHDARGLRGAAGASVLGLVDLLDERIGRDEEGSHEPGLAAAAALVAEDDGLTAKTAAGGAAGAVSAAGGADAGLVVLCDPAGIVVVDLDVIVDLLAGAAGSEVGVVQLDTVLVDLDVGGVEDLVLLAEHPAARVDDAADCHESPVDGVDGSAVADVDVVGIVGVEPSTSRLVSAGGHYCDI